MIASDAGPADYFGVSVAVSGDTAVVGAYGDDDDDLGWVDSGSAYVFVRSGDAWTQQARLIAPDPADFDYFGYSVAVDRDTAVIGAYQNDPRTTTNAGAAYVFVRSGGVWTQQVKLVASDASDEDWFGFSVALAGNTVVIGACQQDGQGKTDRGAAYVFVRSGAAWMQQARLVAADAASYDYFGRSVAVAGETAVIGAYGTDLPGAANAGAAYVFVRSGSVWTQQAKLTASDGAALDDFGFSVAVNGDAAVVGAMYDDNAGGSNAGAAYVFARAGTTWYQQAKLTASDGASSDAFGRSVAIAGDTALIGANQDDHSGSYDAGSAYVFARSGVARVEHAKLTATNVSPSDFFGSSVAVAAGRAAVGALFHDQPGANDAGEAYVFCLDCVRTDLDCDGDVDGADRDLFEACASGAGVPHSTACESQDMDLDGDVDQTDFAFFQRCYSGQDTPADPNYAD